MQRWRGRVDDSGKCNRAVLVSVAQFVPGVSLGRRPGADKDTKTLHRTLSKLGFKVDIHSDLSGDEIYQLFLKESRRPVKDCFLAVLSSHGDEGCVFGADGKPVQLCRLFSYFDNENMEKKAKVFLVQTFCTLLKEDGNRNLELTPIDPPLPPGGLQLPGQREVRWEERDAVPRHTPDQRSVPVR
ncbi:hypothetical protein PFLUV_G00205910 [Perca fluviatilis]|uniref:Caspase family p20 domain-containing protein n=1 Tax=Perca fluviatilis TaxID=8168 RepID=A0A6A5EAV2_PERFL|nr:hypothetical protein PFLUV_G00205910 [Perca fluviatilis]